MTSLHKAVQVENAIIIKYLLNHESIDINVTNDIQ